METESSADVIKLVTFEDSCVSCVRILSNLPQADEAERILVTCATLVEPILKRHNWTVGSLTECYSYDVANVNATNTNRGEEIKLRLRSEFVFVAATSIFLFNMICLTLLTF